MKVLVLGIDGMDPRVCREANMPNLKKIGEIIGIRTHHDSGRSWGSFITGVPPAEHGIEAISLDYDLTKLKVLPIWDIIPKDKKVGIAGLPIGYPPQTINGWFVGGLLARPSDYARPIELQKELNELGWREPFEQGEYRERNAPRRFDVTNEMLEDEWKKILPDRTKCFKHLMKKYPVDLNILIYRCLDWISHRLFNNKPKILEWYARMDKEIGEILQAEKFDKVMIISDHGFKPILNLSIDCEVGQVALDPVIGHHRKVGTYVSNFGVPIEKIEDAFGVMKKLMEE